MTKKHCCPYCLKLVSKLPRHMTSMHMEEKNVKRFTSMGKRTSARRAVQNMLRKQGDDKWNSDFDLNGGLLIVSRRHDESLNKLPTDYTICPFCLGYYTKTNIRHHAAACQVNPERKNRILKKVAAMVEGRIHSEASDRLAFVISFMRDDAIVALIRYDELLIVFGNKMCLKYTPHYQENMIRARLRLMGRLLHEIKKIDPNVSDFKSIYHVEQYRPLVSAIKVIGRFNSETNEFGAPAMAACAVTFVKLIGKYLVAHYVLKRDPVNKTETKDFLEYMETDIGISINKLVTETQAKMRRRKQENIPTMDDVKMMMDYVNVQLKTSFDALSKGYSLDEWLKLVKLVTAWIIVFNRRRVGEVQNITVEEFHCRQSVDDQSNEQMMSTLSEDAKTIARKFKRLKIRGKLGRTVPVLLKPIVDKAINLILSCRQEAGISTDRQFLFELPSSCDLITKVVNACEVLRNMSVLCGASNPTSLRGTNLRKHMATKCISLELNDSLVSEIADFMGHEKKIHYEYYRHNPLPREVVNIVPLLEAAIGKDLDDDDEDDYHLCDDNGQCGCADPVDSNNVDIGVINNSPDSDDNESQVIMDDTELGIDIGTAGVGNEGHTSKQTLDHGGDFDCQKDFCDPFEKQIIALTVGDMQRASESFCSTITILAANQDVDQ
ncbi:hypothetical protein HA402_000621 [Bradysia odoriphaga]|nr:hypothetical protein HA402_000621 [Bradysia odoriphaga]